MSLEPDFLLNFDPSGVIIHHGANAEIERLREWLYTPVTSRFGNPEWGNNIGSYRHEPMCNTTARAIENSILLKLPLDCPDLPVAQIRCDPIDKDLYRIAILTRFGMVDEKVMI